MNGTAAVSLTVNGDPLILLAGPGATLLDMLRSQAQLTGSKQGCNSGVCGACTALVDGKTARACLMLAADCAGRSVVTVEGLDDDPHAAILREEMAAAGAVQCGYCTPGIMVALTDLFRNAAAPPDAAALRQCLGGNICRCTGYVSIVEAAVRAGQRSVGADAGAGRANAMTAIPDAIGKRLPRRDAADKLAGAARYTDDLVRPGMLHAAILGSPYPSARILGIDTAAARALPGVKAVLTSADLPARRWGLFVCDETPLAAGVVRYVGEPVAAVAAADLATARAAAALIEVDYEELTPVLSIEEALKDGAIPVHPEFDSYEKRPDLGFARVNEIARQEFSEGDVEAAWADCHSVVEGVYEVPSQSHVYLEPVSAIAEFDRAGKLTVWSAHQSVYKVQATLSRALDLPMSNIRVATPAIGGAFGGKSGVTVQPLVAHLARATGRPVKLTLSREEDFMTMRRRHPAIVRVRTGAKADGTLVARDLEIVYDGGAYAEDSPAVLGFGLLLARGPYNIPHCRLRGRAVYTNRLRAAGFRGYGNPQVTFATESQIDELADRLGLDPVDFRLKNAVETGGRWIGGQTITSCGLAECLTKARGRRWLDRQAARYRGRSERQAARHRRLGLRPYLRPARHVGDRAAAGGRHGDAGHRRGRSRPGRGSGAGADLRRRARYRYRADQLGSGRQ